MAKIDQLLFKLSQRKVKLWLEGDRLRYKAPKNALTPELLDRVKEHKADIITFLQEATNSKSTQLPPIEKVNRNSNLSLSFAQQRLWFLHQFEPESSSNNMPVVVKLTGLLEVKVLERSISEIVRRHEVLRTKFPSLKGQVQLNINRAEPINLPLIDLRDLPQQERDAAAFRLATQEARQCFDLANGPILRVKLFRLRNDEHLLIWNLHCIVCDGASSDVFYQDLTSIYTAFVAGKPSPLPELKVQYVDFAHWQRQWLQGEVLESQVNYWKQKLDNLPPSLKLPYDRPYPKGVLTYQGDRAALMLPKALNVELERLSQKSGATLFMTLLTAFKTLLYRYCGQEDILLSFASAGRAQVETERLIGFFSNTLMLRTHLTGQLTFKEALAKVRQASLEAYAHQDLPFEKLIEEIRPNTRQKKSPLFQVKFALNPPWSGGRGMASVKLPELTFTSLFGYIYHGKTKYDLTLVMREQDEGLGMVFDYNADIFNASTVEKMLLHFQTLLEGIVTNPDCLLEELPMLAPGEQLPQSFYSFDDREIEIKLSNAKRSEILDETEAKLVEIWQEVLEVDFVSIQDNFFDLGGNSLLAVKTFARIEEQFDKVLPLSILLKAPTIEKLSSFVRQDKAFASFSSLVLLQEGNRNYPPLFCIHGAGFNILIYRELAINLGLEYTVYGIEAQGLDGTSIKERLEEVAADYLKLVRSVQPKGPYFLAGLSKGGDICLEMAQQLVSDKERVALVGLFDSYGPGGIKLLPPFPRLMSSLYYAFRYSLLRAQNKWRRQISIKLIDKFQRPKKTETIITKRKKEIDLQVHKNQIFIKDGILSLNQSKIFLIFWMERLSQSILEHSPYIDVFDPLWGIDEDNNSISEALKRARYSYNEIYKKYRCKSYSGRITLFRAMETPPGYWVDRHLGWNKIALKGVKVYWIPGHHISIVTSPILAQKLKICIDKANQDTSLINQEEK
ncbi:condensation domain-containing protein [Myxosarcina sp. GI1]|uniref:condensation domain-containing protein n=1 Tax=Myxosarcina sp. GI1 TaxID=1541065 RepID=UPI00068F6D41|nr:condensation domain-containing protein [Myxosarcina sp. GI1]